MREGRSKTASVEDIFCDFREGILDGTISSFPIVAVMGAAIVEQPPGLRLERASAFNAPPGTRMRSVGRP
jgi:hypothetical protein